MGHRFLSLRLSLIKIVTALSVISIIAFPSVANALSPGDVGLWQTSTPLPVETFVASGTEYNGYVYNIDGTTNAGDTNNVYYAKLNTNGSVGAWATNANVLPNTFHRASTVAYNGYIYVVGGYNGVQFDTVYYAPINASNGSVGTWNTTTVLPTPNESEAVVIDNGHMYVIGGGDVSGNLNTVLYAPINPDGTLGSWVTSPHTLPQPIRRIGGTVYNGYVYITGGITTGGAQSNTVYYAKLNTDGSVGTWATATNALPTAVWDATSVVNNGFIYNIGGDSSTGNINTVYYAKLNTDGSVGTWATATNALPDEINGAVGFVYNNFVYNIGGQSTTLGNVPTVYYAALTPDPITPSPVTVISTGSNAPDTGFGESASTNPWSTAAIYGLATISLVFVCLGIRKFSNKISK